MILLIVEIEKFLSWILFHSALSVKLYFPTCHTLASAGEDVDPLSSNVQHCGPHTALPVDSNETVAFFEATVASGGESPRKKLK